jgi:hypothetical protein
MVVLVGVACHLQKMKMIYFQWLLRGIKDKCHDDTKADLEHERKVKAENAKDYAFSHNMHFV